MKRPGSLALLALVVALVLTACGGGGSHASLGSDDAAVVGDQTITKQDLAQLLDRAKTTYAARKQKFPQPGTRDYNTLQGQALDFLVQRAQFAQKAADMGIHVSDKQINDRIDQLKKQFYGNSEKKYEATLKQQGLTPDQAKVEVKAQLISEALYKKLTSNVHVSDAAVLAYYQQNKSVYQQKASRDIRHILVNSKALADRLHTQLLADKEKNFAALAKKYSKDPGSAANGGRLTVSKGQTVPPFDKVAFSLKTGELSQPVHTQYGWHIIQALSAIRPPSSTPLNKVRDSIRQQLEQQKKTEVMTKWVDGIKKDFCKPGQIKYQVGYAPNPDPCAALNASTTTTG